MNHWLEELVKFDYEVLNDSEFKEDSVREEIIMPLMKALGYLFSRIIFWNVMESVPALLKRKRLRSLWTMKNLLVRHIPMLFIEKWRQSFMPFVMEKNSGYIRQCRLCR